MVFLIINSNLYTLDYDNKVDLRSILSSLSSTYIPAKNGVITCRAKSTASNGGIAFNQHGITLMFINPYQANTRGCGMSIVDNSTISVSHYLNISIEELYYIPFQ